MEDTESGLEQTAPVWAVFGDLMSGLLGAFVLLLLGVLVVQLQLSANLEAEVKKRQVEEQRRISLEKALAIPLASGRITLNNGRIGISGRLLFSLNSDALQPDGRKLLNSLVLPLRAYLGSRDEMLMVSGFTDDRSVSAKNQQFADNWELSAQRALTVTRALIEEGMPSSLVFAAAFGSEQPITPNVDEKSPRAKPPCGNGARAQGQQCKGRDAVSEAERSVVTELPPDVLPDGRATVALPVDASPHSAAIAALRLAGAERLDPVQLHYLESLNARAQAQAGPVQRVLEAKLAQAVAAFTLRLEQTQAAANTSSPASTSSTTLTATVPAAAQPTRESLGDLVRSIASHAPEPGAAPAADMLGTRTELKSVKQFRNTWSKLSADKQVAKALVQAPKNAGPINSHMLVLRSLALMREISPDYLNRFMSYADTLLCLEQHEQAKYALPGKAESEAGKKPKAPRRAKAGRSPA